MARGHFRHERQAKRRDEQLGHGHEEVEHDEHPGAGAHCCFHGLGKSAEFFAAGVVADGADGEQEGVADGGYAHAVGDFTRG